MEDYKIKELLEQVERQPSPRCWQAIESTLPATGIGAASLAAKKGLFHLSSTALKVSIGIGAAVVAGTVLTLALLKPTAPISPTIPSHTAVAIDTAVCSSTDTLLPSMPTDENPNSPSNSTFTNLIASPENNQEDSSSLFSSSPTNTPPTPMSSPHLSSPNPSSSSSSQAQNTVTPTPQQPAPVPSSTQRIADEDPLLVHHTIPIEESKTISLTIPNVFTPNNDGVNDFFEIVGIENCEQHRLIIKNQTGRIVFQSTNYQNNWDAAELPNGTYFYQLAYKYKGIEEVRSGTITILR